MERKLLILTFICILLLGGFHQVASAFYLYWDIAWFDTFMHFLGGFSLGLLFLWARYASGVLWDKKVPSLKKAVLFSVVCVIIASIGWEVFEYVFDIANPTDGDYLGDTSLDLIADVAGAYLAGVVGSLKKMHD